MKKKNLTVEDLIMMDNASINLKDAAMVLGWGYKTILEMAKSDTFPQEHCIIRLGNKESGKKFLVMRVKLITFITGESYEEQIQHKKKIVKERQSKLRSFTDDEMNKLNKIINSVQ